MTRGGLSKEPTVKDVYPPLLGMLSELLYGALEGDTSSPGWYGNFYRWFTRDMELWEFERSALHHLQAFGGMGSFNDLVPDYVRFPGGKKGFEGFCAAHRLLKELSYHAASLWEGYRGMADYDREGDVKILFSGVPITVVTCAEGHRILKEDMKDSFYRFHAANIASMQEGYRLIASGAPLDRFREEIRPDPLPVLAAMKGAVDALGLDGDTRKCRACRTGKGESERLFLIGDPVEARKEYFIVEPC